MGNVTPLYHVEPFGDIKSLISRISEKTGVKEQFFELKGHIDYFSQYFPHITNTAELSGTIITEYKYVDKDYLEDYQNYYVRCFKKYRRKCTRIHFFNLIFNEKEFEDLLINGSGNITLDQLNNSYLGFIIAKPLPSTIIGKTCLVPYPETEKGKNYRRLYIKREYKVNLFGLPLTVESLGFQEQDHVVAACATTALYTAFQGTSILFNHQVPTPSKITQIATNFNASFDRILPSSGLTHEQMAQAIKDIGLECDGLEIRNSFLLTSLVSAYLKARIPLVLTVYLVYKKIDSDKNEYWDYDRNKKHAVAITGYRKEELGQNCQSVWGFSCDSYRITKIYVHDDQVGPYARMEIVNNPVQCVEKLKNDEKRTQNFSFYLSTSLLNDDGERGKIIAIPNIILAPLYHKIRINLTTIQQTIKDIDDLIKHFSLASEFPLKNDLIYKIYLTHLSDFKKDIRQETRIGNIRKKEILFQRMPKYLWRCDAYYENQQFFSIIFDATDLEQGNFFITLFEYSNSQKDNAFYFIIMGLLSNPVKEMVEEKNHSLVIHSFLRWLKKKYGPPQINYNSAIQKANPDHPKNIM